MAVTGISFRWLDILEKEFDTAFVDLDIIISDFDSEEPGSLFTARQKLTTLSSCFAQLIHKAQTIFQNSAKVEAELVDLRAELVDVKAKRTTLSQELHALLLQLHASQLQNLPGTQGLGVEAERIRRRLEDELQRSPSHVKRDKNSEVRPGLIEVVALQSEISQLRHENSCLRNTLLAMQSEVYGARLTAKYLDKELAGRIQQLQLLGREMRGDLRDQLWRQLESEILLHRHKTIIRACRNRGLENLPAGADLPQPSVELTGRHHGIGEPRNVVVTRDNGEGLGLSITGGREHGVPILISDLEPQGPAARSGVLYVGDAILCANGQDLKQACHQEAVDILSSHKGDMNLEVQYLAAEDSEDETVFGNSLYTYKYRFFDDDILDSSDGITLHPLGHNWCKTENHHILSTPTAPRTPELPNTEDSLVENILPGSGTSLDQEGLNSVTGDGYQLQSAIVNCSSDYESSNVESSQHSPMHTSTDGSNVARSSNSEESLIKSSPGEKVINDTVYTSEANSSVPSTPNNNQEGTFDDNSKKNDPSSIRISTLQQIFDDATSNITDGSFTSDVLLALDNRRLNSDFANLCFKTSVDSLENGSSTNNRSESSPVIKSKGSESKPKGAVTRHSRMNLSFPGHVRRHHSVIKENEEVSTSLNPSLPYKSSHSHNSGKSLKLSKKVETKTTGNVEEVRSGSHVKKRNNLADKIEYIDTSSLVVGNSPTKNSDITDHFINTFGDPNFGTRV